jgi:hypothetical protein
VTGAARAQFSAGFSVRTLRVHGPERGRKSLSDGARSLRTLGVGLSRPQVQAPNLPGFAPGPDAAGCDLLRQSGRDAERPHRPDASLGVTDRTTHRNRAPPRGVPPPDRRSGDAERPGEGNRGVGWTEEERAKDPPRPATPARRARRCPMRVMAAPTAPRRKPRRRGWRRPRRARPAQGTVRVTTGEHGNRSRAPWAGPEGTVARPGFPEA